MIDRISAFAMLRQRRIQRKSIYSPSDGLSINPEVIGNLLLASRPFFNILLDLVEPRNERVSHDTAANP